MKLCLLFSSLVQLFTVINSTLSEKMSKWIILVFRFVANLEISATYLCTFLDESDNGILSRIKRCMVVQKQIILSGDSYSVNDYEHFEYPYGEDDTSQQYSPLQPIEKDSNLHTRRRQRPRNVRRHNQRNKNRFDSK